MVMVAMAPTRREAVEAAARLRREKGWALRVTDGGARWASKGGRWLVVYDKPGRAMGGPLPAHGRLRHRQDGGPVATPTPAVPGRIAQLQRDAIPFAVAVPSGLVDGYLNASGSSHPGAMGLLLYKSTFWRAAQLAGAVGLARVPQVPLRVAETVAVDGAFGLSSRLTEWMYQWVFEHNH